MSGPTCEHVLRMAREAGLDGYPDELERFAALAYATGQAAEREACANVCDDRDMRDNSDESLEALRCAAAIRARGAK